MKGKAVLVIVIVFSLFCGLRHVDASQDNHQPSGCPPWTTDKGNDTCECYDQLNGLVLCLKNNKIVSLPFCYCMAYNEDYKTTVVDYCDIRCHIAESNPSRLKVHLNRYKIHNWTSDTTELNRYLCSDLKMNREGQLCGRCIDDHAPPVYSYTMDCKMCPKNVLHNILKYLAVAYLPLTLFYVLAILFRFTVTTGSANGFILTSQILFSPGFIRMFTAGQIYNKYSVLLINTLTSFYGIWNLDFFRSLYTPFCIHPRMTAMSTLALEYGIAVYPLLLILLTYISVRLHNRYSIVVRLWKPFYYCFRKIRNEWDINNSLIETFATFLLLSYIKILNTSFLLLTFVCLLDHNGTILEKPYYLQYDATVEYFGTKHAPYAALALIMTTVFTIFPLLLLGLYPCRCFQKFLYVCKLQNRTLRTFMNTFQLMFKTHPRDYRYFAAFFLLLRMIIMFLIAVEGEAFLPLGGILAMIAALFISILRPYKVEWHNHSDAILLGFLTVALIEWPIGTYINDNVYNDKHVSTVYKVVLPIIAVFHPLYGAALIVHAFIPKRTLQAIITRCTTVYHRLRNNNETTTEPIPHRLAHPSDPEYAPLLDTADSSDSEN